MKISFEDIEATQQALTGLDPQEVDAFWQFARDSIADSPPGAAPFHGAYLLSLPCDRDAENQLFLQGPVTDRIRAELQTLSPRTDFAARGALTQDTVFLFWGRDSGSGQIFITSRAAADAFLLDLYPKSGLTDAELAVMLDLLIGYDLRYTAQRDARSLETKRTLLKRVLQKTGAGKQTNLVSHILGGFLLAANKAEYTQYSDSLSTFRNWKDTCFPQGLRALSLFDSTGEVHHLIEAGAPGGKPVIGFMPALFPYFQPEHLALLEERNLRLVMPLRRGALDPTLKEQTTTAFFDATMRGAELAAQVLNSNAITVLGISNAAGHAARFAARHPAQVARLVLSSPLFANTDGGRPIDRLRAGFERLAHRSPRLHSAGWLFLRNRVSDQRRFKRLALALGKSIPSEDALLERELATEDALSFYHTYIRDSLALYLVDPHPDLAFNAQMLDDVQQSVSIFVGPQHQIRPASLIDDCFVGRAHVKRYPLPEAGHVLRYERMSNFINLLADRIAQEERDTSLP